MRSAMASRRNVTRISIRLVLSYAFDWFILLYASLSPYISE